MSTFWGRLNARRSSLVRSTLKDSDDDENMSPETKNEVFEMFAKSTKRRNRFARGNSYSYGSERDLSRSPQKRDNVKQYRKMSTLPRLPKEYKPLEKEKSASPKLAIESCSNVDVPEKNEKDEKYDTNAFLSPVATVIANSSSPASSRSHLSETALVECSDVEDAKSSIKETGSNEIVTAAVEQKDKGKRRSSQLIKRGSTTMDPIKKVNIDEVYTILKQVNLGRFGQLKLAENRRANCKIALKYFPVSQTKQVDFIREYNCSFFLSPHPNVIDTYEGMYQAHDDSAFFFVQEICPGVTLKEAVESSSNGIGEAATRCVMEKVLSAIEFMHSENLVHRNIRAENILIFDPRDFSRVKLTNFGLTRKVDSTVKYQEYVNNYHAPELCETVVNEVFTVNKAIDIWALGIVFYYCLKGKFPWQKATIMCKPYWEWEQWIKRKSPQLPKRWEPFSEKALKLLKKTLNPKYKDRWSAKDVRKLILKEKLLKSQKSKDDDYNYYPKVKTSSKTNKNMKRKSVIHQWISATLNTMAEISEQVVSARDDL